MAWQKRRLQNFVASGGKVLHLDPAATWTRADSDRATLKRSLRAAIENRTHGIGPPSIRLVDERSSRTGRIHSCAFGWNNTGRKILLISNRFSWVTPIYDPQGRPIPVRSDQAPPPIRPGELSIEVRVEKGEPPPRAAFELLGAPSRTPLRRIKISEEIYRFPIPLSIEQMAAVVIEKED